MKVGISSAVKIFPAGWRSRNAPSWRESRTAAFGADIGVGREKADVENGVLLREGWRDSDITGSVVAGSSSSNSR